MMRHRIEKAESPVTREEVQASLADIAERKFWKQYMQAYEECLSATSTAIQVSKEIWWR